MSRGAPEHLRQIHQQQQNATQKQQQQQRAHLFVSKNPEKPKKVSVDLTGHTYDGRCKRLVDEPINVLVFVVLDVDTSL